MDQKLWHKVEDLFHAAVVHIGLAAVFLVPLYVAGHRLGIILGAPKMDRYLPGLMVAVMCERFNYMPTYANYFADVLFVLILGGGMYSVHDGNVRLLPASARFPLRI